MGHALSRLREGRRQERSGDHDFTKDYSDRKSLRSFPVNLKTGVDVNHYAPLNRSLVPETGPIKEKERSLHSSNRLCSRRSRPSPPPPSNTNPLSRSNILYSTPLETSSEFELLPDPFKTFLVKKTVPVKEYEYDFCIIHSPEDATEWVRKNLLPTLEIDHGLKCCVDWKEFFPGRTFADNIEDFILKSRKTIAVVSNGFLKSKFSLHELELAVSVSRRRGDESLIFIILDNVEKNRLPKALNKRNTIDLATSEKTLKEELFPFLEVRTKQSVKQVGSSWRSFFPASRKSRSVLLPPESGQSTPSGTLHRSLPDSTENFGSSWRSFLPASGKSRSGLLPPESGQSTPSGTLHRPLSDSTESFGSSWRSFLPASGKSRSVLLPPESGQSTPSGTLHRPLSDSTESFSEKDFEYDFYIIHSRTDATEWVQRNLLPTLEMDHGLKCCVDRKDFLPGRTFADNIENFILKSRKTIAVLSNGFLKSDVSVHELQLAVSVSRQREDESVIIIKIDNVEMNLLPEAFNEKNVIDLTTSEKTLEEELFPFLEVRAKQGVKQGTAKVKESSQQVSSISSDLRFPSRPPSPLVSDKLSSSTNIVLAGREKEHEDFDIPLAYQTGGTEKYGSRMAMRENPPSRCTRISSNIVINREDNVFNIGPSVTLACPSGALDSRLQTLSITLHLDDPSKYYGLIVRRDLENDFMFGAPVINIEPSGHYFKKPLTLATKVERRFRCQDVFILHGFKAREGNITWHDITHNSRIDEANAEVDIEIYHFSLIAILLRLGRSTLLCTKDIASRLNLVPFNYTLSVLLNKSSLSSVHDELALLFVSQDVYCEQFYREDETSSALMRLKKEGFKELHVRSTASEEEKSIYNNETLQIKIHLGEDYKLANKEQESICLTVNSYDWWHEGEVMRIPLEWKKDVRSLCGKVSVTGEYGHTSERHFRERELCGYVRSLLGVEGVIFNVIPIAHLLGIPKESINQIAKSQNDEDEDLEMILKDWSKERDFVDNLAVLRKSLESLKQKDIKVTQRGQMYIRHVRKLARKISGLQCVNADSQSYFIHKIQALCKSVFRDCCIELESSSDDVERAASFTNHAEYLIQSMEILRPIPEVIAEKYHQLHAESSQESMIKTFMVIVPFLIQNIKDIFIEDRTSEVPQNGLRGLPKDKLGNFVSALRNAEENDNLPLLICEFCNILEQLCVANYDRNQPNTEIEKWSKSLAVLPMLNFLKPFFQYCPQDIRLHKRLDLFSCSIKDIMANRDKIDDFSVRDLSNVLLSLIHFAKFDPSKLVRFELSDSENVPLSCSREGVKYDQFDNAYSELFRIKKQSNDELHLHAFARVYVNGDTYSKGTFQSTAMLAASSKNALKECVTCFHDVTVVMTEVKGSGNLRVVFFSTHKEKLLELLDVLRKELRAHVVDLNRSEVTQCPLSMRSVTSKTDAVLSLRLVYEWGSEAVFLDSKDFVMSSPSTCHVPRVDEIQISIKMMDDTLATIAVNPSDSISSVKKKIHRLCKCPSDQLRLVFAGKKLEDDLTLNHYNVQNKSTLHLVQRLRGVARNPRRDANGNDAER